MKNLKLIYAVVFDDPGSDAILQLLLVFAIALGGAAAYWGIPALGGLALVAVGLLVWLVRLGMMNYHRTQMEQDRAFASKWAYAGVDANEVRHRFTQIEELGPRQAMLASGAGYTFNFDGTPMLGNTGIDILGRVFGDTREDAINFDPPEVDAATGVLMEFNEAYAAPIGMDNDFNSDPHRD